MDPETGALVVELRTQGHRSNGVSQHEIDGITPKASRARAGFHRRCKFVPIYDHRQ